ncbi:MAG: hypothetical protein AB1649_11855 [Chloroflexota bacterium]
MKKLLITTLILLTLTLTACTASASPTTDTAAPAGSLPMATQLMVGTFKLDGTDQDVTAEQAAQLLTMWQVYSELLASDTAAQEEIDGVINQIQETMTDEQMQAITDMNLTQQDLMAVMQEQGLGMAGGPSLSADQIATAQAMRESSGGTGFAGDPPDGGGMPMGAPPDGGGMPGGAMPSTNQSSSGDDATTTESARGPMGGGVSSALMEALIELLKTKADS